MANQVPVAYQMNRQGVYVGTVPRQPSPMEPNVWWTPAGAVLVAPPTIPAGQQAVWVKGAWVLQSIPVPTPPPLPPAPTGPTGGTGPTGS